MNKLLVVQNKINDYSDDSIIIENNKITFLKSNNYVLEYIDSKSINLEFNISDNIEITIDIISLDNDFKSHLVYNIEASNLLVNSFYNNKEDNEVIDINLNKEKGRIDYYFSNICRNIENYQINIYHNAKRTISNIYNKSITIGNSSCNYIINSYCYKENIGCTLKQDTKIITMGDNNSKICPNMYIDLEDIIASHASMIGKFNDDELFYLMSRGLTYKESIKLLIKGFLINKFDDLNKRKIILNIMEKYWG